MGSYSFDALLALGQRDWRTSVPSLDESVNESGLKKREFENLELIGQSYQKLGAPFQLERLRDKCKKFVDTQTTGVGVLKASRIYAKYFSQRQETVTLTFKDEKQLTLPEYYRVPLSKDLPTLDLFINEDFEQIPLDILNLQTFLVLLQRLYGECDEFKEVLKQFKEPVNYEDVVSTASYLGIAKRVLDTFIDDLFTEIDSVDGKDIDKVRLVINMFKNKALKNVFVEHDLYIETVHDFLCHVVIGAAKAEDLHKLMLIRILNSYSFTSLKLHSKQLTPFVFDVLSRLHCIDYLDLSATNVEDYQLGLLPRDLRFLNLNCCTQVTDAGIKNLNISIVWLNIHNCIKLTDNCLCDVPSNLQTLICGGQNKITGSFKLLPKSILRLSISYGPALKKDFIKDIPIQISELELYNFLIDFKLQFSSNLKKLILLGRELYDLIHEFPVSLRYLNVQKSYLRKISNLRHMTNLEYLNISNCPMVEQVQDEIPPSVKTLKMNGSLISRNVLLYLPNLETLSDDSESTNFYSRHSRITDLTCTMLINQLPSQLVHLNALSLNVEGLRHLTQLKTLRTRTLDSSSVEHLSDILQTLSAQIHFNSPQDVFGRFKNLRKLKVPGSSMSNQSLRHLPDSLRTLDISNNKDIDKDAPALLPRGLRTLSTSIPESENYKDLPPNLSKVKFIDVILSQGMVKFLPGVLSLTFNACKVHSKTLSKISKTCVVLTLKTSFEYYDDNNELGNMDSWMPKIPISIYTLHLKIPVFIHYDTIKTLPLNVKLITVQKQYSDTNTSKIREERPDLLLIRT